MRRSWKTKVSGEAIPRAIANLIVMCSRRVVRHGMHNAHIQGTRGDRAGKNVPENMVIVAKRLKLLSAR